jgi:phenylacetate-coenzyme A ligase PaaK-like adenylate-forming protein
MVRFDVKDLVQVDKEDRCACGRDSGFILSAIEGRVMSATLTCDGRLVTLRKLDDSLSVLDGVDEYRLEQPSAGEYDLHLVSHRPDRGKLTQEVLIDFAEGISLDILRDWR